MPRRIEQYRNLLDAIRRGEEKRDALDTFQRELRRRILVDRREYERLQEVKRAAAELVAVCMLAEPRLSPADAPLCLAVLIEALGEVEGAEESVG